MRTDDFIYRFLGELRATNLARRSAREVGTRLRQEMGRLNLADMRRRSADRRQGEA